MQQLMQSLRDPAVQGVIGEFFELLSTGVAHVDDATGKEAMRLVIGKLFDVLEILVSDRLILLDADDDNLVLTKLQAGREYCMDHGIDNSIVAMFLLRRKLRALGSTVDEEIVIRTINEPMALIAPGLSVLEH